MKLLVFTKDKASYKVIELNNFKSITYTTLIDSKTITENNFDELELNALTYYCNADETLFFAGSEIIGFELLP